MNLTRNSVIRYLVMAVIVILAFFAGTETMKLLRGDAAAESAAEAMIGQNRPSFALPDLKGMVRTPEDWAGSVLVVNFWATWCAPCQKEMPSFNRLQKKYASQGLQFIGIALDEVNQVKHFAMANDIRYPILVGGDTALEVSDSYGNSFGALPYTVFITREGIIKKTFRGEISEDRAEELITMLL